MLLLFRCWGQWIKLPPWHKLGTVTKALRSDEVIKIANLDYNVVKVPNLISLGRACRTAESEKIPFNLDSFCTLKLLHHGSDQGAKGKNAGAPVDRPTPGAKDRAGF